MKKGISELVSAALILAITIGIAGIYSQWAPDFSEDTAKNVATQAENRIKCSNAAYDISSVDYDLTAQTTTLNVSNTGTISFNNDITITAVNSSRIISQKTLGNLEVEEKQIVELRSDEAPDTILAVSQECPELRSREDKINVKK